MKVCASAVPGTMMRESGCLACGSTVFICFSGQVCIQVCSTWNNLRSEKDENMCIVWSSKRR